MAIDAWLKCPEVNKDLRLIEKRLISAVECADSLVNEVCSHLIKGGGKRLRPALVLLGGQFGDRHDPLLLEIAIAVELLHTATLYHDDIIDEGSTRRTRPTANKVWGNQMGAFAGDYLLARATHLFAVAGDKINQSVSRAISSIWGGQMREIQGAHNFTHSEGVLLDIIDKKTATLFELSCHLGAQLSRASPARVRKLAEFGRNVGIAFQLTDDVMDIITPETRLGKHRGMDLKAGVCTLPVHYTVRSRNAAGDRMRSILSKTKLTQHEVNEALAILLENDSIARTLDTAKEFIKKAKCNIKQLPDGCAKESLNLLTEFIIDRVGRN